MSRPIYLTDDILNQWKEEFEQRARSANIYTGDFSYKPCVDYDSDDKAKVIFTPSAYLKMLTLLREFSDEVAWHGVVDRRGDDEFVISDILVYPQEVSGSTVNTDQEEYTKWTLTIPDDVFNRMHMQGHSHVNMACSPSSTDLTHQEAIVRQLNGDHFYIFMIWNKRLEHNIKIYDYRENTLYEDKDCIVSIDADDLNLTDFIKDAKELVKRRTFVGNAAAVGVGAYAGGLGHYGNGYGSGYTPRNFHNGYVGKQDSVNESDREEEKKKKKDDQPKRETKKRGKKLEVSGSSVEHGKTSSDNSASAKKFLDGVTDFDSFIYGKQ